MNPDDVVDKTETGVQEIRGRALGLSQRVRGMLIMIDGRQTVAQLQAAGQQVGAPPDFLESLLQQRLVVVRTVIGRASRAAVPAPQAMPLPAPVSAPEATPAPAASPQEAAERFRTAQKLMNDTVADAVGVRAVFFTIKLERCFKAEELLALLPDYTRLMGKARGADMAANLEARVRALLG